MKKNSTPMQTKIFLAYLLVIAVILVAFSLFFYNYVSKKLIRSETEALSEMNSTIRLQVESAIQGMDTVSNNINYSSLIKEKLNSDFSLDITSDSLNALSNLFSTVNGTDIRADQINLFDLEGNEVSYGLLTRISKVDLASLPWLDEVLNRSGSKLLGTPQYSERMMNFYNWSLSLYRTFVNPYGRTIGAVETSKSCKSIFQVIFKYQRQYEQPADVYIFNQDGILVYPYDLEYPESKSYNRYYEAISNQKNNLTLKDEDTGYTDLLNYSYSKYTGWTYILVQKESVILQPIHTMLRLLLIVAGFLMFVAIFLSYTISKKLVRPIKHLKHIIQDMEIGTLGKKEDPSYKLNTLEIEELYQAFYHMSQRLKTSMNELVETRQQEVKSRALALQSQMNPHFYYNSLSSIMVLAEGEQSEEIVTMCRNLSQIMRYITDSSSMTIELGQEVDYVKRYLYCMKVRYQSSLIYTVDVDESLLGTLVPKLLLQPLVENALKYGVNSLPPWNISIVGKSHEDRWQIDIIDSGPGFTEEAIEKINSRIAAVISKPGMPEMHIDGMGLLNIYLRWRLYCGERMLFTYGNTEDGHGKVSLGCYHQPPT